MSGMHTIGQPCNAKSQAAKKNGGVSVLQDGNTAAEHHISQENRQGGESRLGQPVPKVRTPTWSMCVTTERHLQTERAAMAHQMAQAAHTSKVDHEKS